MKPETVLAKFVATLKQLSPEDRDSTLKALVSYFGLRMGIVRDYERTRKADYRGRDVPDILPPNVRDKQREMSGTLSGTLHNVVPVVPVSKNGNYAVSKNHSEAVEVLNFLNVKTGKSFRAIATNLRLIEARLASGATVQDCKSVIARQKRVWETDPEMHKYLRPATLFNATKFEQYLGEKETVQGEIR